MMDKSIGLLNDLWEWEQIKRNREKFTGYVNMILVNQKEFHDLMMDEKSREYIKPFYNDRDMIIGHKVLDVPIVITDKVEKVEFL